MSASKAKQLSSLIRDVVKGRKKPKSSSSSASTATVAAAAPATKSQDSTLKKFLSSIGKVKSTKHDSSSITSELIISHFAPDKKSADGDLKNQISDDIFGIISASNSVGEEKGLQMEIPWISTGNQNNISAYRKEVLRERKQKYIHKMSQGGRFNKLVQMCATKLGTETTVKIFGRLGRETGLKEFTALIRVCIEEARQADNEDVTLEHMYIAYQLLSLMKQQGFEVEEETYGQLLMYFIDMEMIEEFHFFCNCIHDEHSRSVPRLGYYEMLLYIRVNDELQIQELCSSIAANEEGDCTNLQENYLLALCEADRKNELLQVLERVDITKISSPNHVASIFRSLGRLILESSAEKYFLAFKDLKDEHLSTFIFNYASSIPNLVVEDIVQKFNSLHSKLEVTPSTAAYEKLILFSCGLNEVYVALNIIDQICEAGLTPSINSLNSIFHASEEIYEFHLGRRIYSLMNDLALEPNSETYRSMISLSVKLKDFEGAYNLLDDMKKVGMTRTATMYNYIMAGYFKKKDVPGALMVLEKMKLDEVKPDSQTYCCLINFSDKEEDVTKYYDELKSLGTPITKYVSMALINAYAACGEFEKAKQVVFDKGIPVKSLPEVKSALVLALASHGQLSDALSIFEEIKESRQHIEPKVFMHLIDNLQSEEQLIEYIQLLDSLHWENWIEGCCRLFSQSVRLKNLSVAIDLFEHLEDKLHDDELTIEGVLCEVYAQIADMEPPDVQLGLDLLQNITDKFGLSPPRKCLDFLLSACVRAKDMNSASVIWEKYQRAGLPYDILSYLFMYQVYLASRDRKSASKFLLKFPKDDVHVRYIIRASKLAYQSNPSVKKKEKKKVDSKENKQS